MLDSFLAEARRYVSDYGYGAIFLGVFLESFGLPAPGESLMIAGALLAAAGRLDIVWVLALCWAASVIGDNIGYVIGRQGGRPLVMRYGLRIGVKRKHIEPVEDFFQRHGGAVVLFARFVVVVRQLNGVVAGILGMSWGRFLAYNAAGAAIWVGFWSLLAYWSGHRLLRSIGKLEPILIAGIIAMAALGVLVLWLYRRKRKTKRRR